MIFGLIFGLTLGLIAGLSLGLILGLSDGTNWLIVGLIAGLSTGLIGGLSLGLFLYGGLAFIQHFILRFILYRTGQLPFRLVPFLDYCVDRIFLRRVGGGYKNGAMVTFKTTAGDVFTVIKPQITPEQEAAIIEQLREILDDERPNH